MEIARISICDQSLLPKNHDEYTSAFSKISATRHMYDTWHLRVFDIHRSLYSPSVRMENRWQRWQRVRNCSRIRVPRQWTDSRDIKHIFFNFLEQSIYSNGKTFCVNRSKFSMNNLENLYCNISLSLLRKDANLSRLVLRNLYDDYQ